MSMAVTALDTMNDNAVRVREVAMRLLAEHSDGLPKLIGVRPYADPYGPRLELQPRTNADAAVWAQALGVTLSESFAGDRDGWRQRHMSGHVVVDGVRVHVGACEWVPSAAAGASAVAA
jgi:hypothetical protein